MDARPSPAEGRIRIETTDPDGRDSRWCLEQYYAELVRRFDEGFDVGRSTVSDSAAYRPPAGAFLVARLGDRPVGCGALTLTSPRTAYIKRMWIDGSVRGMGLGRRMLTALEGRARELGCDTAELETNRALTAAIRLYESAGYEEVAPFNGEFYAHHWFRKTLADAERG